MPIAADDGWINPEGMNMKKIQAKLPAHLQKIVDGIEEKEKSFGITNMAEIINNIKNPSDFHPIHAICRGN